MGIHNVHGAMVAKSLCLRRIVLSRECTLEDIKEIKVILGVDVMWQTEVGLKHWR